MRDPGPRCKTGMRKNGEMGSGAGRGGGQATAWLATEETPGAILSAEACGAPAATCWTCSPPLPEPPPQRGLGQGGAGFGSSAPPARLWRPRLLCRAAGGGVGVTQSGEMLPGTPRRCQQLRPHSWGELKVLVKVLSFSLGH